MTCSMWRGKRGRSDLPMEKGELQSTSGEEGVFAQLTEISEGVK